MEVEMKIRGLMMDPMTNMPVVILKEACGSGILPIWVGVHEANAIALEIERVVTPRPMTHDLLKNVLLGLQAHVQKVVVTSIKDETFYALIWVDREGELVSIDSRPSDAFALETAPLMGVLPPETARWVSWALGDLCVKLLIAVFALIPYRLIVAKWSQRAVAVA